MWAGLDDLSACGSSGSDIAGLSATAPASVGVHGKGVVYGDSIYAIYNNFPDAQWTVFTKLKCNKKNKSGQYA